MAARSHHRVRVFVALTVAQITVLVAGVAFAEWLANGTGSGYAKARRATPLTTSSATASESLYPGGTGDAVVTVNNANPYPVTARGIAGNGAITSGVPACDDAGSGVSFVDQTGAWLVPANGSATLTLISAVAMASTSPDSCQGATFTIPVRITGQSGAATTTTSTSTSTSTTAPGQPAMSVSPTSHAFGSVPLGQSAVRTFVFTNTGNATATNLTPQVAGQHFFINSTNCTGSLAPSTPCNVEVRFSPTTSGSFNGIVSVSGPGYGATAQLSGVGATPPQLAMPSSVNFPPTQVGQSSTVSVPVTNTGGTATGPLSVTYTGPNAGEFSTVSTTCGAPLPPGQSCGISIQFAPATTGMRSAAVTVANTTGPGTATATLNGQGA